MTEATNSHDALVVAIEDMEESRENLEGLVQRITTQNDALVAALEAVEWAVPPTHIQTNPAYDGACPSCYAGKPVRNHKFYVIPAEYHMKDCQLAAALEQVK